MTDDLRDIDPVETQEWMEAVEDVLDRDGPDRAHYLLNNAVRRTRESGANLPFGATTGYQNTIPADQQLPFPGNLEMEWRIRTINRWNAMATVVKRNKVSSEYGGHIASFASSAVMYDIGLNHFWRAQGDAHGGDLVFFQGHVVPGIYARSFMEGRISKEQLENFRSEVGGNGLSSYPHPWLMPDFWQFPTVSMGLGPIMAIYQARFMKYMHNRGHIDMKDRKVWAFLGDGEMDEPESRGAIGLAGAREARQPDLRDQLQPAAPRRTGARQWQDRAGTGGRFPRRRLERHQGCCGARAGTNCWSGMTTSGRLRQLMDETRRWRLSDVQIQGRRLYARAFLRQAIRKPRRWSADWTDDKIWALRRGGHDPEKVFMPPSNTPSDNEGQPTLIILVKTVKGYGMGDRRRGSRISLTSRRS